MLFLGELHWCPRCQDFVPYVNAVHGSGCSECGRPFTDEDERAYLAFRGWRQHPLLHMQPGAGPEDRVLPEPAVG